MSILICLRVSYGRHMSNVAWVHHVLHLHSVVKFVRAQLRVKTQPMASTDRLFYVVTSVEAQVVFLVISAS